MADVTPTLSKWPGPNRVGDYPSGVRVYDPPALGRWKGLEFLALSSETTGGRSIAKIEPPYVPGQLVHDMGRKAEPVTIRMLWVGDDWKVRMENFVTVLSQQSSSGELAMPDGGAVYTAHVDTWSAPRDYALDSCEMTVTWAEDSQVDHNLIFFGANWSETAVAEIPATDTDSKEAVENFRDVLADPDATDEDIVRAYKDAGVTITEVEEDLDLDTVDGVETEEGYEHARGLMASSVDDPAILDRDPWSGAW